MNLYEITQSLRSLFERLDPESGEIPPDLAEQIAALNLSFEAKLGGYIAWAKELNASFLAITGEMLRLGEKAKVLAKRETWVKAKIMEALKATNSERFESPLHSARIQKNGGPLPLIIRDGTTLEEAREYVKIERKIDTDAVRGDLEYGVELEFAKLGERGEHLRIS